MKSPNQNKFFIINLIIVLVFSSAYIETEDELENVFSVHDQSLLSVLYMQTSAEFIANNLQVYENAAKAIDLALSDKNWSAAIEQNGDFSKKFPAIIIDVDETVLDNSPYQARAIKDNFGYPNGWIEWGLEESASSVAGAKKFLDYAKSRGVKIFYVTNRLPELREATINNFKKVNIPFNEKDDVLFMRDINKDKTNRRIAIAEEHRILLLIGDQLTDFISMKESTKDFNQRKEIATKYHDMWGKKWFIITNPVYGRWEDSLYDFERPDSINELIKKRKESLNTK